MNKNFSAAYLQSTGSGMIIGLLISGALITGLSAAIFITEWPNLHSFYQLKFNESDEVTARVIVTDRANSSINLQNGIVDIWEYSFNDRTFYRPNFKEAVNESAITLKIDPLRPEVSYASSTDSFYGSIFGGTIFGIIGFLLLFGGLSSWQHNISTAKQQRLIHHAPESACQPAKLKEIVFDEEKGTYTIIARSIHGKEEFSSPHLRINPSEFIPETLLVYYDRKRDQHHLKLDFLPFVILVK